MITSVYIHIPFCEHICSYCDFSKLYYYEELVDKYLIELEKEIKSYLPFPKLKTLYIGGGTPSSLNIKQLDKLFSLTNLFSFEDNYEFTIECNIENIDDDKLKLFKRNSVNRISIGVESFQTKNLDFLNRNYSVNQIKPTIELVKENGFDNINIDLMYAIPGETIDDLKSDIDNFLALGITHISTYSLILEKNTKLTNQNTEYIDEDLDLEMYQTIHKNLTESGFNHYEISNFSLPGYESKHNLVYWHNEEYYGFGLGSSGYLKDIRYTNKKSIQKYLKGEYKEEIEYLTKTSNCENEIILRMRTKEGIDKKIFKQKFGIDFKDLTPVSSLIEKGYIKENQNNYYIPFEYWYVINEILVKFVEE